MSEFRTIVSIPPEPRKFGLKNTILTAGSCFADAMGNRFHHYKFQVLSNPFGATYNPVSIHKSLEGAVLLPKTADGFVENQGWIYHYDFHSNWSSVDREGLADKLQGINKEVKTFIETSSVIILTYGTSWVYRRKDNGSIVANCHKIPADRFDKKLLSENEIVDSFKSLYHTIKKINPTCLFILTVSPVRHIKDTLELNSVSKAILRTACHSVTTQFADVHYFPAYEIMMDDLRDYRFYKSDMIHPTEDAENYIWKKFSEKYFDADTIAFMKQWDQITSALQHRAFHPKSESHQKFLRDTLQKLKLLQSTVNVDAEIADVQSQLH
jgi:hypothetical protein